MNLEDGCQLAMKLLTDASGNPSQIDKDWKDLELIRFVGKKPNILGQIFPLGNLWNYQPYNDKLELD